MNTLVCLCTNLLRLLLVIRMVAIFFDTGAERKKIGIIGGVYYFVNTAGYLIYHMPWVNIATNVLGIVALTLLYTQKIKKMIFVTSIVYILNIICDYVAVFLIIKDYQLGEEINQLYSVITVLLFFICEVIIEKMIDAAHKNLDAESISLLLVPLCSIIVICILCYFEEFQGRLVLVVSIGMLLINLAVLFLYNILLNSMNQQIQNEIMTRQLEEYKNQIRIMTDTADRVRSIRHDLKNHLIELEILTKENCKNETLAYLSEMRNNMENPEEGVDTGNPEVDSLLNYWLMKARDCLQKVTAKVAIPKELSNAFDMSVIMGNLLENALEAARNTTEQSLNLEMRYEQGTLWIMLENSMEEVLTDDTGKLISMKKDKRNHGLGLKNIEKIVKKYNGEMKLQIKDHSFRVEILLFL